jgi:hypothetical protein
MILPSNMVAATLIATTSARIFSFECELFKFIFGVVMGDTAEQRRPPNTTRRKNIPKYSIHNAVLVDPTGDTLTAVERGARRNRKARLAVCRTHFLVHPAWTTRHRRKHTMRYMCIITLFIETQNSPRDGWVKRTFLQEMQ